VNIERDEILKIGQLARLELTDSEIDSLGVDLNNILTYVKQLESLDTTGVPTLEHAAETGDTWRDDVNRPSLPREKGLSVAPAQADGCFSVPKIME